MGTCTTCQSDTPHEFSPEALIEELTAVLEEQTRLPNESPKLKLNQPLRHDPVGSLAPSALRRLEACWIGYTSRRQAAHLRRSLTPLHPYFSLAEVQETLSSRPIKARLPVRTVYRYKSGALYKGEWLGGFRHGVGSMQYQAGETYSGTWVYGRPCGHGRFQHRDGDVFEGQFRQYFCHPTQLPTDGYSKSLTRLAVSETQLSQRPRKF